MAQTPNLKQTFVEASQSQKHVPINENMKLYDAIIQLQIIQLYLNTPPVSPVAGDRYIVGGTPTGAWAGKAYKLAYFVDGVWSFSDPVKGWIAYNQADGILYVLNDSNVWVNVLSGTALTINDTNFVLQDNVDNTKQAQFELSGITTATTRTYTLPNVTGALATLGNLAQTFAGAVTVTGAFAANATSVTATAATTLNLAGAATASTVNIGYGATTTGVSKTVNVGTGGVSGSTTSVNIGSSVAGATSNVTLQGTTINLNGPTAANNTVNISAQADASGTVGTVNIGTGGLSGSTTNVNIGSATAGALGTITIAAPTVAFPSIVTAINATGANISGNWLGLGGATADNTNRFSINTSNLLLNNAGAGINMTFNKNAAGDDASLSFKTDFTAYAIAGLLANNDFTIKVGTGFISALTINNTTGAITLQPGGLLGGGRLKSVQKFTAGGTWTRPSGIRYVVVEVIGGGGGGGGVTLVAASAGCAGGGGAGAYVRHMIDVTALSSAAVLVGAAGAAGANTGGTGGTGGTSSFNGAVAQATGGTGGVGQVAAATPAIVLGGNGGTASPTTVNVWGHGGVGQMGNRVSGTVGASGGGAAGPFGGGGLGRNVAGAGDNAVSPGSGGGGALSLNGSAAAVGGTGAPGLVTVWEYE